MKDKSEEFYDFRKAVFSVDCYDKYTHFNSSFRKLSYPIWDQVRDQVRVAVCNEVSFWIVE